MLIDTLHDEALKIVFRFLNERDRLRFMVTNKRFKPLLQERRTVANEALERLRMNYPNLCFKHHYRDADGWTYYHTYTVRLYRGDPDLYVPGDLGLMLVTDEVYAYTSKGLRFSNNPINSIFSPWACAFVDLKHRQDDRRINANENARSLHSMLVGFSRRVV